MSRTFQIAGTGAHPLAARGPDLYETPPEAVHALMACEALPARIWEPACGPGSIVRVLEGAGHRVLASDLHDWGCPGAFAGIDFLQERSAPEGCTCIVTNPPYGRGLATRFVAHALTLVPMVAMLLRLPFLESSGRSRVLEGGRLRRVHVFRNRLPRMHRNGWTGPRATSATAYAWFVFSDEPGPTVLDRISWRPTSSGGDVSLPLTSTADQPPVQGPIGANNQKDNTHDRNQRIRPRDDCNVCVSD